MAKGKVSQSQRAGLILPVGRISRMLRKGNYAQRFTAGAPISMTAVLEYLTFEILDVAAAVPSNKTRITPRQIHLGIRGDEELNALCTDITIREAGVVPRVIEYPGTHGKSKKAKAQGDDGGATGVWPDC